MPRCRGGTAPSKDRRIEIDSCRRPMSLPRQLFWPAARPYAAWGIIAFLIAVLPVHIFMLIERNEQFAYVYRWFIYSRPFIQLLLMYWAFLFTEAT